MLFGIKISREVPCIMIVEGIYIFVEDPKEICIFQKICKVYPRIWYNDGLIDVLVDQQIKISFVEGQQKTKFNFRFYLFGYEKRTVFDKKYDLFYEQSYIEYMDEVIPITFPVFIVWRVVKRVKKGCIVVDLRLFNKIAISDNYLLSL